MSVLIKGMKMPKDCVSCRWHARWGCEITHLVTNIAQGCPLVEVPTPHGRLIDADELHKAMYHRAFETDGDTMWQSGCWVRYRAIEQTQDSQPTIIEAEEGAEE